MRTYLEFEKPIAQLEAKIEELRHLGSEGKINIADEVAKLEAKAERMRHSTFSRLTAWQKVQVARHPERPHGLDYIQGLMTEFNELAGDRNFAEDRALIGGIARFRGRSVVILAQEKGHDMKSRVEHNFGMAKPEGYRKAIRLMRLADRFNLPIITLVDTSGAYPGIEAEARGQAEAIARSIETCLEVGVPIISVVIGEGGSGGAIAIATGNSVLMLEHAVYSVISPEGCASILWRSADQAQIAAEALKLTAKDLFSLGIIDQIIEEPSGGSHRSPTEAITRVGDAIEASLNRLANLSRDEIKQNRRQKYIEIGKKGLV
ncbi:MAG: acetyl-CoA carboxylase carboxyltransferase subunit alpha [Candidatus Pacebacteria bacterium]|nr:acetyl-CoA carboxylase carboxyltransferase subunit alpha [Candidatus Paceibacterota bacterium]